MQISPNVAAIIKIVLGLLTAVSAGTLSFTGILSPSECATLVAISSSLIVVIGIVMSGFSSSAPGALAPADPPVVVAATKLANLPSDASQPVVAAVKAQAKQAIDNH